MSKKKSKKQRMSQAQKRAKAIAQARMQAFQNRHLDEREKKQAEDLSPLEQSHWESIAKNEMDRMWGGKTSRWR